MGSPHECMWMKTLSAWTASIRRPLSSVLEGIARGRLVTMLFADPKVPVVGWVVGPLRPKEIMCRALTTLPNADIDEVYTGSPWAMCRVGHVIRTVLLYICCFGQTIPTEWLLRRIVGDRVIDDFRRVVTVEFVGIHPSSV